MHKPNWSLQSATEDALLLQLSDLNPVMTSTSGPLITEKSGSSTRSRK